MFAHTMGILERKETMLAHTMVMLERKEAMLAHTMVILEHLMKIELILEMLQLI
jgi:hypothetical protein